MGDHTTAPRNPSPSMVFHSPHRSHGALGKARARAGLTALCKLLIPQPRKWRHSEGELAQQQLTGRPRSRNNEALSGSWGTALSDSLPPAHKQCFNPDLFLLKG